MLIVLRVSYRLRSVVSDVQLRMKLVAEYLADAIKFERLAASEENAELRQQLVKQAKAYEKLAKERAKRLGLAEPNVSTGRLQ